jgi:tetratricopeptide (TPR) repeat protein
MYSSRQQSSRLNLGKWVLSLALLIGLTTAAIAQEKSAASIYNEGLAKLKEKDYEAGYPLIEEALKVAEAAGNEKVVSLAKRNGAKAAYNLGSAKRKAKAYDEALVLFERGIELNPKYSSNYMGRAMALEGKGDGEGAVKGYLAAADLAKESGKADRAAQLVKKATSTVSKLYKAKKYDAAIAAGVIHIELKENANIHYYMAKCYEKKKVTNDAENHINKAVELATASGQPVPDKYYWLQGNVLESLKKNQDATAAYKKISGEKYKANAEYRIKELGGK